MKKYILAGAALVCGISIADNPLVTHLFTADPSARVFDGVLYIYASHDIPESDGVEGVNGFVMEDYHVFSTTDLMNYTDHGIALTQDDVPWAMKNYSMWAPDCMKRGDTYYFYFPTQEMEGWFKVGVAVSSSPTGPFAPESTGIENAAGIDPGLFIDEDGTPYLYFGCGTESNSLKVAQLNEDMKTLASRPQPILRLDPKHDSSWKEGSFMFKRNGIYYFSYPVFYLGNEIIFYATGSSPTGPFVPRGKILDATECLTSHHSVAEYKGQWVLFYHTMELSGDATLRSMAADKLYFNSDGSIQPVIPTRRGIGIRKASAEIQVDRYLEGSPLLSTPRHAEGEPPGFYLSNIADGNWMTYPDVDFGSTGFSSVSARIASSGAKGKVEVRVGSKTGTLLGTVAVSDTGGKDQWEIMTAPLSRAAKGVTGVENLCLVFKSPDAAPYHIDWVRFD